MSFNLKLNIYFFGVLSIKDVHILPCAFSLSTNWPWSLKCLFVRFHPKVASYLLSRAKGKYAIPGMRLWWKYIRNYTNKLHISAISRKLKGVWRQNFRFGIRIIWASFIWNKKLLYFRLSPGDKNVIGISTFKMKWISYFTDNDKNVVLKIHDDKQCLD